MPSPDKVAAGLRALAPRYDAVFCDIWGVIHNGIEPYSTAVDALVRYRAAGGKIILISNAARPAPNVIDMMLAMGVPSSAFDRVVTSGDVTRHLLRAYAGKIIHHIGPPSDNPMLEGLDIEKGPAEKAAAVVVTGLNDPNETPDDYEDRLNTWQALGLPLVCANPDLVVEVGTRMVYCPGALADVYEARGGKVEQAGKPFAAIYDEAYAMLSGLLDGTPDKGRILAIGDAVRTDAMGAAAFGIDFLFITGSLHAGELDAFGSADVDGIADLIAPSGAHLVAAMPRLRW